MSSQDTASGINSAMGGMSMGSKSMQAFTSEITKMSKESMEQTTQYVEKLRSAKTIEDVVAVQSSFMQQSFSAYANYTRRFGELLTMLPLEMAKQGRSAMQQGTETVAKGAEQTGHHMQEAADHFKQNEHDHNQSYNNNNNNY